MILNKLFFSKLLAVITVNNRELLELITAELHSN